MDQGGKLLEDGARRPCLTLKHRVREAPFCVREESVCICDCVIKCDGLRLKWFDFQVLTRLLDVKEHVILLVITHGLHVLHK